MQALRAAALDGVDVRLLVPGGSDIPLLGPLSRAGYRPLLESGVRVYEWKGPMMHAKTAVADGIWARVGSTNLNIASWLGNYELDASIEDRDFGAQMEESYLKDLSNATEIVLDRRSRARGLRGIGRDPSPDARIRRRQRRAMGPGEGSTRRVTAGALRLGNAVSSAITDQRPLGRAELPLVAGAALAALVVAVVAFMWPRVLAWPVGMLLAWLVLALAWQAFRSRSINRSSPEGVSRHAPPAPVTVPEAAAESLPAAGPETAASSLPVAGTAPSDAERAEGS